MEKLNADGIKRGRGRANGKSGFTLTEVLIAMFISLIISAMLFVTLERQSKTHIAETETVELQEKIISVVDLMGKEIRLAGYLERNDRIPFADKYTFTFMGDIDNVGGAQLKADIIEGEDTAKYVETVTYIYYPSQGRLIRVQGTGSNKKVLDFVDGLDDFEFSYYDADGDRIYSTSAECMADGGGDGLVCGQTATDKTSLGTYCGEANLTGNNSKACRDSIRRIRITLSDSTESAAAAIGDNITKRSRTVVREVAPPNLSLEPLVACGALVVSAPTTLAACNPPGEDALITITTYALNDEGQNVLTNKNDINISVNPVCQLFYDEAKTDPVDLTLPIPEPGNTRLSTVNLYLESGSKMVGDDIEILTRWRPAEEGCSFQRVTRPITIVPGDPCEIEMETIDPFAYVCDDGSGRCPSSKKIYFVLKDDCGNAIPNGKMEFQIQGNDASGTRGWLSPPDDPGTLYPTDDGPVPVIGGDGEPGNDEKGRVGITYTAPTMDLPGGQLWVTIEGIITEKGEGCQESYFFDVKLLPCTPDHLEFKMEDPIYGCMNMHVPIDVYVKDYCGNNVILSNLVDYNQMTADLDPTNKDVITATLTVPQDVGPYQDETISMWEEVIPFGTLPYPPNSFTVALRAKNEWGFDEPFYRILYNSRTDEPDRVPRGPFQVEFTYHGIGYDSSTDEYFRYIPDPVGHPFDLSDCNCNIWAANYPEYFCNPAGGLTLACPYDASLWAVGGGHDPDNEGRILVTSGTYQVELRVGDPENPDVYVSQTDEFPFIPFQETEFFTWPFWLRNKTFPINGGVALRLEERNADGDLMCTFDWSTTILCSEASLELLDREMMPAITYDPYDPDERVYVELSDCNRPAQDSEDDIEVDIYTTTGDHEVVKLYADDPTTLTTYRNRDDIPITALTLPTQGNGILEVGSADKIWVDYYDDTAECGCIDMAHDEVDLISFCVTAALYSGAAASFQGTAFRVHWGDVVVFDDIDFTGQLDKKVPKKDRTVDVGITTGEYSSSIGWKDRWVDIYVGGVINGDTSGDPQPFLADGYSNIYQNVPSDALECVMIDLDYEELKQFAIDNDVYYYADDDDENIIKRHADGSIEPPRTLVDVIINDSRKFIFVDVKNAPNLSPQPTGETIDAGAFDAYFPTFNFSGNEDIVFKGVLYIAGNVSVQGMGAPQTYTVKTPPLNDVEQVLFPPDGEGTYYHLPVTFDTAGPLPEEVQLDVHIFGVFYIEGFFDVNANMMIFGSIAAEGGFRGQGNPEIWYNYLSGRGCNQNQCCALTIHPSNPDIPMSSSYEFTADGGTGGQIIWSFKKDENGDPMNPSGGTITEDGLYTPGDVVGAVDTIQAFDVGGCAPGYTDITVTCPTITIDGPSEIELGQNPDYDVTGGKPPYTWSVDYPVIASIDPDTGQLTTHDVGPVKITVTDANGCKPANDFLVAVSAPVGCKLIYFNDFDGDEHGNFSGHWSTCSEFEGGLGSDECHGQDDWQMGDPDGDCGDPENAYSGSNVIGNDIGNSGWNGCYANNVTNYIISPAIDTTGYENIEIHFQRWARVRSYDHLYLHIYCNSTWYWDVLDYTNLGDTSWNEVSLSIPTSICADSDLVGILFMLDSNSSNTRGGWNIDDFYMCGSKMHP